jgi:hypothetical protein
MPAKYHLSPEMKAPDRSGSRRGLLDDPIQFAGNVVQGAALGTANVGYDITSVGVNTINGASNIMGRPEGTRIDIGTDFYDALDRIGVDTESIAPVTKGFAEFTKFAITTTAVMGQLSKLDKFKTMMQSSKALTRYKAGIAKGAIADLAASSLHFDADGSSIFELLPEHARPEMLNWFVNRDDNSDVEIMLKNAFEEVLIGGAAETVLAGVSAAFRSMKGTAHTIVNADAPEEIMDIADTVFGRQNGEIRDEMVSKQTLVGAVLGDDAPKRKRYTKVETKSVEEIARGEGTIHSGQTARRAITKKTGIPAELDMDTIEIVAGVEQDVARLMKNMLADPTISKAQKKMALDYADDVTRPHTRLNIDNSGAASTRGGLETNLMLNLKTGFTKRPPRARAQAYVDTLTSLSEGSLGLKLKGFVAEGAYDEAGVMKHLSMSAALGYDVEEIIIASQVFRSNRASTLQKQAQAIVSDPSSKNINKMMNDLVSNLEVIDYHDAGIQATVGSGARILNYQQINPSDMIQSLATEASTTRQKYLKSIGKEEAAEIIDTPLDYLTKVLAEGDTTEVQKVIAKIAKAPSLSRKDLAQIVKGQDMLDFFEAGFLGSLLSGLSTTIGSVGIGGAMQTGWKLLVQATAEGVISDMNRALGGVGTGARSTDGIHNAVAMYDVAKKVIPTILNRHKAITDVIHVGFDELREGADLSLGMMKKAEIKAEMKTAAKTFEREGAYVKSSIMTLAQTLAAPVMALQNINTRAINSIDSLYKGFSNEVTLRSEARRFWHAEGGSKTFGADPDTFSKFSDKFYDYQKGFIEITKTVKDIGKRNVAMKELFKGTAERVKLSVIESVQKAQRIGAEATLQQDASKTIIGNFLADMKRRAKHTPVTRLGYLLTFSFTKTPTNYLSEVIDSSPLAFTTVKYWDTMKNGTPDQKLETLAKIAAGTAFMSTIAYAVSAGTITGTLEPTERDQAKAQGKKEHSWLVDGTWYNYENMGPFAALISSVANTLNLMQRDPDASLLNLSGQVMALGAENSNFGTFSEIMDIINDPNKVSSISRFGFDKASGAITPLSGAQRTLSDIMVNKRYKSNVDREVGGLAQELQAQLASALKNNAMFRVGSDMVGAGLFEQDVDVAGNDIRAYSDTLSGKFLHLMGVGNMNNSADPYVNEGIAAGAFANNTSSHVIHGVKMTSNEYKKYSQELYHGQGNASKWLNMLVRSDAYMNLSSDEQRKEMYTRTLNIHKAYQKEITFTGSSRMREEKHWNDIMETFTLTRKMQINPEDPDYIRTLGIRKQQNNLQNEVTRRDLKEELGINLKEK